MRYFEKISFAKFQKSTSLTLEDYNKYNLPKRSTKNSAGYDFEVLKDFTIKPGEIVKVPTGIKANMERDEVLMVFIRSSLGFKYNLRMCNQVGIIDSDYYNNSDNEGHIFICIQNEGKEEKSFKQGDKIAQGIFTKFLTVDNEEEIQSTRTGGFGSTDKENKNE